jgi:hypothetical protein
MNKETAAIGVLTDSVPEGMELDSSQIEGSPRFGSGLKMEFLHRAGKSVTLFFRVLDIANVFADSKLGLSEEDGGGGRLEKAPVDKHDSRRVAGEEGKKKPYEKPRISLLPRNDDGEKG